MWIDICYCFHIAIFVGPPTLHQPAQPYFTLPHPTSPHPTPPYPTMAHTYPTMPHPTPPCPNLPHHTAPYPTVSHPASPYLTLPRPKILIGGGGGQAKKGPHYGEKSTKRPHMMEKKHYENNVAIGPFPERKSCEKAPNIAIKNWVFQGGGLPSTFAPPPCGRPCCNPITRRH